MAEECEAGAVESGGERNVLCAAENFGVGDMGDHGNFDPEDHTEGVCLPRVKFALGGGGEPGVLEGIEEFGVEGGAEHSEFKWEIDRGMVPKRFHFVESLGDEAEALVEIGVWFA